MFQIKLVILRHFNRSHDVEVIHYSHRYLNNTAVPILDPIPEVEGFDELKASHFPDAASCEFAGLIEGKWKDAIQKKVDEYVNDDLPVEIEWWSEDDFKKNGLERLITDNPNVAAGEKFRVVKIVGADTYPCGGTHVDSTAGCGKTTVRKISRSKGTSRVSYAVA